jgi:hypothetical protein
MSNLQEESRLHCDLTDDDCDDIANHDESIMSNAQKAYLESNSSKEQLFLMCFGLTEGWTLVFDLDAQPWYSIKKRDIKSARIEYAEEIRRQSKLTKCIKWLQKHPVLDQQDVSLLKNEVTRVKDIILSAQQEQQDEANQQAGGQKRGLIPHMRLFMCLTQDDIKSDFLRHADARTRHELDARNLVVQPPSAFELISGSWNDEDFNLVAPTSESCQEHFSTPINCAHSKVAVLKLAGKI